MRGILVMVALVVLSGCSERVAQCVRRCEVRLGSHANAVCTDLCGNAGDPGALFQIRP